MISSLFAHKVANATAPDDAARRRALLESVSVDPDAPVDPKTMVPDADYYAMCERAIRDDPDGSSLTVRVGRSMCCNDYGAFGLAFKTAPDLRASYARAERYGLVLTSVTTYQVVRDDGRMFMTLNRDGPRDLGMRLSNEQSL
ncbi:MAG: AraC family transcriptional regulator ligand-binding domain-containing protein, partial [Pseudomonadota bacterium]